jgi:hypothetical protein
MMVVIARWLHKMRTRRRARFQWRTIFTLNYALGIWSGETKDCSIQGRNYRGGYLHT